MIRRRAKWRGALVALTLLLGIPSVATATAGEIVADLDGTSIYPSEVGLYYCHDLDYPAVHCFRSASGLEVAVAATAEQIYVTVYSGASYSGSYAHLLQDYDGLWSIGWNDRISSFKPRNSASGSFHEDWYAGGWRFDFCCDDGVPWLSDPYDNAFSSVYRTG